MPLRRKKVRQTTALTFNDDDPDASLLVRTDFTDETAWAALLTGARAPYGLDEFAARFVPISDESFDQMNPADLAAVPGSAPFVFAADAVSMFAPEATLLVVDRSDQPGRFFRVVLPEAWGPENNLRLANMDFGEFVSATDEGGVFRGFPSGQ